MRDLRRDLSDRDGGVAAVQRLRPRAGAVEPLRRVVLANFGARGVTSTALPRATVFEDGEGPDCATSVHVGGYRALAAFRLAMEQAPAAGHVINIGSGQSYSIAAVARMLGRGAEPARALNPEISLNKARSGPTSVTASRPVQGARPAGLPPPREEGGSGGGGRLGRNSMDPILLPPGSRSETAVDRGAEMAARTGSAGAGDDDRRAAHPTRPLGFRRMVPQIGVVPGDMHKAANRDDDAPQAVRRHAHAVLLGRIHHIRWRGRDWYDWADAEARRRVRCDALLPLHAAVAVAHPAAARAPPNALRGFRRFHTTMIRDASWRAFRGGRAVERAQQPARLGTHWRGSIRPTRLYSEMIRATPRIGCANAAFG